MQYTTEIIIDRKREDVVRLFDDPDNLHHWMVGLQSFKHISGTPGQPGAVSEMVFKNGNRTIAMTETIVTRNLPDAFTGTYDAQGVHNIVENYFEELPGGKTKYTTKNIFNFNSFMMKVIGALMPGAFKKQSYTFQQQFKAFVESKIPA